MSSNICGDTSIILDDNSCIMKESSERWNRNKVISIAIVVLVVAVFVISLVVYSIEQSWTAAGTICMAGIAGIGIVYSSITVSLMKEETRPYVFVDFIIDKNAPSMIDIELINCGKSSAIDVDIKVIAPEIEEEMLNKKNHTSKDFRYVYHQKHYSISVTRQIARCDVLSGSHDSSIFTASIYIRNQLQGFLWKKVLR